MRWRLLACLSAVCAGSPHCGAYGVSTHQWMTSVAFARSVLSRDSALLDDLRIERQYAAAPAYPNERGQQISVEELLRDGARLEDDDALLRPLNHFFDVQHGGRGLTTELGTIGAASPDWALASPGRYPQQRTSLRDAINHFYLALVGASEETRRTHMGTTLGALGRAAHHLQDMAQPQHVRNDAHPVLTPLTSAYEAFSDELASKDALPKIDTFFGTGPLPPGAFSTARKFWEDDGRGIAEFTSRNFVSAGTNFHGNDDVVVAHPDYPFPAATPCSNPPRPLIEGLRSDAADLLPGLSGVGLIQFVATPIRDRLVDPNGGEVVCNTRSSSWSVFDPDLRNSGFTQVFSLNSLNYRAAQQFLVPRAIAYSAALIDHFFRARLAVEGVTVAEGVATLIVRNLSAAGSSLADGLSPLDSGPGRRDELEVWYESLEGIRKPAGVIDGADLAETVIRAGETHEIRFRMPLDLIDDLSNRFVLVFRGSVGLEEGVAGIAFDLDQSALLVHPSYIPSDGLHVPRTLRTAAGRWRAMAAGGARAGNLDWRGHRRDDVLTWDGPPSRYFYPAPQDGGLSTRIYRGGSVLTHAPQRILGAAIHYGGGTPELRAITYGQGQIQIFVRPFREAYENDALLSRDQPLGWRLVHAHASPAPQSPAFFNASGNEAQFLLPNFERWKLHFRDAGIEFERKSSRGSGVDQGKFRHRLAPQQCGWELEGSESHTVSWQRPTVVCADYRGDTEVLCQIDAEGAVSDSYAGNHELTAGTGATRLRQDRTLSSVRTLVVGAVRVPLYGEFTETHSSSNVVLPIDGSAPTFDARIASTTTQHATRILFMDARNGIVAYVRNDSTRNYLSQTRPIADGTVWVTEGTISDATARHERVEVVASGLTHIISSQSESQPPAITTMRAPLPPAETCGTSEPIDIEGATPEITIDDAGFTLEPVLHDRALQLEAPQFAGVGAAGHVLISMLVPRGDLPGAEPGTRSWNYLSEGDLGELLPAPTLNATYFPGGVIR